MARKLMYNEEEGGMAKAQLQKIEMYAAKLNDMIHPEDELEGWVQNKLSVVAAYMGDVKHYLDYALQNEPEYKEFANGGMTDKPRYWEVEFTWSAADEESRKVNVMAESVSDAEEQVRKKFGPYYEGLKVVEVEEDKEISWEEYAKRPKKFEIESTTDYDVIEADDEEEAKKEWMRRRKGDSYKSELIKVRRKFADGGMVYDIEWRDEEGDTYEASFESLEEAKEEIRKIREEGGRITQTWKYRDGEYVGSFASGGMMDWLEKRYELKNKIKELEESIKADYDDGEVSRFTREMEEELLEKKEELKEHLQKIKMSDGGMMKEKYFSVSWLDPRNGTQHKEFSSKEDAIKYVANLYKHEDYLEYANKEEIPRIYDENRKEVMSGYELQSLAEKQINKMASGGTMRYEGSTMEEELKEAEEYIGKDVWETLSNEDKLNATQYLKAKGVIGYAGQEEDLADFMASQYAKGGSLYRGYRPSPSISATAYPRGFKMIGNDGNMWEISVDSRGVHRWTKSTSASRNDRMEQKAKIREAIELLESMRDEIDVDDEIATLKKLQ